MDDSRLEALRRYCMIDADDIDEIAVMEMLAGSAKEYLGEAGVTRTEDNQKRFDLCVNRMTLSWLDNRDEGTGAKESALPVGLRQVINQLKLDAEVAAYEAGIARTD